MNNFKQYTFTIRDENKRIVPFHEYIREHGSETLYDSDFEKLLKNWQLADWCDCDDYIAPMAAQIITNAAELDPVMYEKIMTVIVEAYEKFRPIIDPPQIIRIK